MRFLTLACFVSILALLSEPPVCTGEEFFVSLGGNDTDGDGSYLNPWRSLEHAINFGIPADGGHTVVMKNGTYSEQSTLKRGFEKPVLIRAQDPYGVTLTNVDGGGEALRVYHNGVANLAFEGFVFTNQHESYSCPSGRERFYLIHIQDASEVMLRDNIISGNNAPGTCNEVIKINRSTTESFPRVVIQGNLISDPANAGGADLIDAFRPGEIDIVDNIFVGNPETRNSQSFITLKWEPPRREPIDGHRYNISRNIFMNWGGRSDQAFIQFGEEPNSDVQLSDALIENNLFIGNSSRQMAAPMQFKGARDITVRANTVVGDLPSGAFGFRIGTEGSNPDVRDIDIVNNVFADDSGTMGDRIINDYGRVVTDSISLDHNLFWNDETRLPNRGSVQPTEDVNRIEGDPLIDTDYSDLQFPVWDADAGLFPSGAKSIREQFLAFVDQYGSIAPGSAAIDQADATNVPREDIRGYVRGAAPDVGAFELGAVPLVGDLDGDKDVDSVDQNTFVSNWSGASLVGDLKTFADGDFDFDQDVDTDDHTSLLISWTGATRPPDDGFFIAETPEVSWQADGLFVAPEADPQLLLLIALCWMFQQLHAFQR